jgi:hypothetical protein
VIAMLVVKKMLYVWFPQELDDKKGKKLPCFTFFYCLFDLLFVSTKCHPSIKVTFDRLHSEIFFEINQIY